VLGTRLEDGQGQTLVFVDIQPEAPLRTLQQERPPDVAAIAVQFMPLLDRKVLAQVTDCVTDPQRLYGPLRRRVLSVTKETIKDHRSFPSFCCSMARSVPFVPATLPGDRILSATVKNAGSKAITVKVPELRVLDDNGRRVKASAQFIRTFAHGLIYPDLEARDHQPLVEQRRIGQQVVLRPGQSSPLIVSWHQPKGAPPATLDYGKGTLSLPADRTAERARG